MSKEIALVDQAKNIIMSVKDSFCSIASNHHAVDFEAEFNFALQHLAKNEKLLMSALNNPTSFKFAITNVASIGASLCPAKKQAYLISRMGEIILDVSYMGLCFLAQDTGAVLWVQSVIVRKNDIFVVNKIGERPTHTFEVFGDRGAIVGAYCVAKTTSNDFLVEVMTIEAIYSIRERSDGYKAYKAKKIRSCPWVSDEEEMIKKTVVRRASKMWPKANNSDRLENAISLSNKLDGINFQQEEMDELIRRDQVDEIKSLLVEIDRDEESFIEYFERVINRGDFVISTLTEKEGNVAITQLKGIRDKITPIKKEEKKEVVNTVLDVDGNEIKVEF